MAEKKPEPKAGRVDIGFNGGQVIATRLDAKALADLRKAAENGSGWHKLSGEDGEVSLNLAEVVFIRADSPEHSVGFSS
jgi:hypothetical protein